jgi:hypothetical protein
MTVYECQCGRRYSFLTVQLLCELSCSALTERGEVDRGGGHLGGEHEAGLSVPGPSRSVSVGKFGGRNPHPGQGADGKPGRGASWLARPPIQSARPPFLPTGRTVNA